MYNILVYIFSEQIGNILYAYTIYLIGYNKNMSCPRHIMSNVKCREKNHSTTWNCIEQKTKESP